MLFYVVLLLILLHIIGIFSAKDKSEHEINKNTQVCITELFVQFYKNTLIIPIFKENLNYDTQLKLNIKLNSAEDVDLNLTKNGLKRV